MSKVDKNNNNNHALKTKKSTDANSDSISKFINTTLFDAGFHRDADFAKAKNNCTDSNNEGSEIMGGENSIFLATGKSKVFHNTKFGKKEAKLRVFDWHELSELSEMYVTSKDEKQLNSYKDALCLDRTDVCKIKNVDKSDSTSSGLLWSWNFEERSPQSNKIQEISDGNVHSNTTKKENSSVAIDSVEDHNEEAKEDGSTKNNSASLPWQADQEEDNKFELVISRKAKKKQFLQSQQQNSVLQQPVSKKHSNTANLTPSIENSPQNSPRSDSTSQKPKNKEQFSWPVNFDLIGKKKKKMPPNRKVNHNHGGGARAQLQPPNQYNVQRRNNNAPHNNGVYNKPLTCCVPTECFEPDKLIYVEDIGRDLEVMKVVCNNEHCDQGQFMHLDCFLVWEQALSKHVKSYGRARSWSEKQRLENIWTKKGYDLAFKACSCRCGRGHLRKDLDWVPTQRTVNNNNQPNQNGNANANGNGNAGGVNVVAPANPVQEPNPPAGAPVVENPVPATAGKKKKSKNREQRPKLAISAPVHHPNNNANQNQHYHQGQQGGSQQPKPSTSAGCFVPVQTSSVSGSRSNSVDYGLGSSVESTPPGTVSNSPPLSQGSQGSQGNKCRSRMDSLSSNGSGSSGISEAIIANLARRCSRKMSERPIFTGDFATRENCSAFNVLPLHKRNPFHVKVNDEIDSSEKASGVDATRMFLLSTLLRNKQSHVCCVLCEDYMTVYDRYPLLDGTFFLSPMPYLRDSIPVRDDLLIEKSRLMEGRQLFLNAVCMRCLEGWTKVLRCKFCNVKWDGSDYMLGTCYNYDIFADVCCPHRVLCKTCNNIVVHPCDRQLFFSDYGNHFDCPHCGIRDYHLVKDIETIFHVYPPRSSY